jgi:hypothetical protein
MRCGEANREAPAQADRRPTGFSLGIPSVPLTCVQRRVAQSLSSFVLIFLRLVAFGGENDAGSTGGMLKSRLLTPNS